MQKAAAQNEEVEQLVKAEIRGKVRLFQDIKDSSD